MGSPASGASGVAVLSDIIPQFTKHQGVPSPPAPPSQQAMQIPAAVKEAVKNFTGEGEFTLQPPKKGESSTIYKWGVRVGYKDKNSEDQSGWICLADQHCRDNVQLMPLYSGKTSNATKHLKEVHNVISDKYQVEIGRKRTREEEVADIRRSQILTQNPKRARLLLETKRIVLNHLPFWFGELDETRILDELCLKEDYQHPINAKNVNHSIVELYAATKRDVMSILQENDVNSSKLLTVMADFWTCKTQHTKYLGLRVYFITKDWRLKSILLGTRRFDPNFGDRDTGIRRPFQHWLTQMLDDFDLSPSNLFGGVSDAGPDVKWMLESGLGLQWEWCLAHLSNAATKTACGLVNNRKDSKNPEMTDLIDRLCKVVRQVRDVEVMGDLFQALCDMEGVGKAARLLDFKSHRFLGLTSVVRRVLERWAEVGHWYAARAKKARDENKVPQRFPLEDDRTQLIQLLSLLEPITVLNKKSQGEKCMQVDTLLHLYKLRLQTLNTARPLRDYCSTHDRVVHFSTNELTPLITKTRTLLAAAFDKNFFSRYTDRAKIRKQSFVFEMQLLLFPTFKNLDGNLSLVARLCYGQRDSNGEAALRMGDYVRDQVIARARSIMVALTADEPVPQVERANGFGIVDEIVEMFGSISAPQLPDDVREGQIEEEIQRWRAEPAALLLDEDGKPENILGFWRRQADSGNYKYLPKLARIVFAMPSSSAQIERDFGSSGLMVRAQRANLSSYNVEMGSFLSCNKKFINIAQCERIRPEDITAHIPSHILVGALPDDDEEELDSYIANHFSAADHEDED